MIFANVRGEKLKIILLEISITTLIKVAHARTLDVNEVIDINQIITRRLDLSWPSDLSSVFLCIFFQVAYTKLYTFFFFFFFNEIVNITSS